MRAGGKKKPTTTKNPCISQEAERKGHRQAPNLLFSEVCTLCHPRGHPSHSRPEWNGTSALRGLGHSPRRASEGRLPGPSHFPQWIREGSSAPAAALHSGGMERLWTKGQRHSLAADRARYKSCTGSSWARQRYNIAGASWNGMWEQEKGGCHGAGVRQSRQSSAPSPVQPCGVRHLSTQQQVGHCRAGPPVEQQGQGEKCWRCSCLPQTHQATTACLGCLTCQKEHPCQTSHLQTIYEPPEPPNLVVGAPKVASQTMHGDKILHRPLLHLQRGASSQGSVAVVPIWGHASPQDLCCPFTISSQLRFPLFGERRAGLPSCS